MKAFLLAMVALLAITVGANLILTAGAFSAEATSVSSNNVRLGD